MDTRKNLVNCLIDVFEKNISFEDAFLKNSSGVQYKSELKGAFSGCVKMQLSLDFFINEISVKKIHQLSKQVRNILRAGIYELEYTENPPYAVINSYVEIAKSFNKNNTAIVNAILRNFLRKRESIKFPQNDKAEYLSLKYSHPKWMVERWIDDFGYENTQKICEFNNKSTPLVLRINLLKISKDKLVEEFLKRDIDFVESEICEDCLIVKHFGDVESIYGFKEGYWVVQAEASSLVARLLDPKEGESVLDVCAAPGGKTTHIASLTKDKASILALDVNKKRLEKVIENCTRLGIQSVQTQVCDAKTVTFDKLFDKILIDAPCSNTGVLAKRPDARWNRSLEDVKNLSDIQYEILENISKYLKTGGVMVYSTCSIEKEENIEVVERFVAKNPDFKLDKSKTKQFLPCNDGIEGFFIAKIIKEI